MNSPERLKVGHYAINVAKSERKLVIGYIARTEEVTFSWSTKWESAKGWEDDGPTPVKPPFSFIPDNAYLALRTDSSIGGSSSNSDTNSGSSA